MTGDNLERFRGMAQFGPAYRKMLENDAHAPGSVDCLLLQRMVRLCGDTADHLYACFTPTAVEYQPGTRPELERVIREAAAGGDEPESVVEAVAEFCAHLGDDVSDDLDELRFGGTEEEIIGRGSDICTDVARVGCILYQMAGLPARIVSLADTQRAYSGHVIVEVHRGGRWGAVDTSTCAIYRAGDGRPATTWQLMNEPALIGLCGRGKSYSTAGQFRAAAISNYFAADHAGYDYTVTGLNDYYRSILRRSALGWPGGLRWLHGEDL